MHMHRSVATAHAVVTSAVLFLLLLPRQAPAQQADPAMEPEAGHRMQHRMFRLPLGDWHVAGDGPGLSRGHHRRPGQRGKAASFAAPSGI